MAAALALLFALGIRSRAHADASGAARGAHTSLPATTPHRDLTDFKAIFRAIRADVTERRIVAIAAGVTFYSLLSIFPAIAALVAVYGLVADPASIAHQIESMGSILPGGAIDVIRDEITRISSHSGGTLVALIVGLAVSLWSANGGVKALIDALNVVYRVEDRRGFIKLNAVSLLFVMCGILAALLALAAIVALPIALKYVGMGEQMKLVVSVGRWPALLVFVALVLALVYRFGPNRERVRWRWITWGSAIASVAWLIASFAFSWYAANFGSYNKTYGSLGAVVGFMVWMWISAIVVLMGAEIDAVLERRRAGTRPDISPRGAA
ncbi:MAG TPA: YihY/virulence factor BrkB family protein [Casimicrobiaceae bacterium]|nr:YihY/virulence factor BrkB family protein [Casimicrobiaceae bacterium]